MLDLCERNKAIDKKYTQQRHAKRRRSKARGVPVVLRRNPIHGRRIRFFRLAARRDRKFTRARVLNFLSAPSFLGDARRRSR